MVVAALLVLIGAVAPWIDSIAGTVLGVQGAGVWTLAAGGMGLAGAVYRHRGVVLAHAVVLAVVPLTLGGWQLARLLALGCDFRACAPGFGLALTLCGGAVAAAAVRGIARSPHRG